jgi:transcriptional regulator with XRE-family HTH domain
VTEPTKLTILDVARLAGVSRSTVSRVMNGKDDVRPEVRTRVRQVIAETGFRPSATARSLVSRRTGVLGLVIPWRVSQLLEDPYFVRLIRGISRASNAAGTTLSLFLFETEEEESELFLRVVTPRLVEKFSEDRVKSGDTRFGINFGGGAEYFVTRRDAFLGEALVHVVPGDDVLGSRATYANGYWSISGGYKKYF